MGKSLFFLVKNSAATLIAASVLLVVTPANAQSHYPGQHADKFAIVDKLEPQVYSFDLNDVQLDDSRFKQNMLREQTWLRAISVKGLLHSFRTTAGIYDANEGGYFELKKLAGWESLDCELRGHTTGHILSALALMYASTNDVQYKLKADSLVAGLAEVQAILNQDGYLSAYPQNLIDRNIAGKKVWAPWYTLHKIFSGLIDQYLYCNNKQALDVVTKMGNWAYKKLQVVTQAQRTIMLRNEFGGINESFYNLYAITGNSNYKWLAEFFYHNESLDPLKEGKDILEKKHANTYIPKLIGLSRDYEIEGKGSGDSIAAFFWKTVNEHHSFATGSNSDKEKFFKPDNQSAHLTGYTGESCNVYNMLKLTKHLFSHSLQIKYADFYEKALFNHILGQQDPTTGMVAYFLPMLPGAHKVYSTPDSSFWCCVGSGFENQAKYGESIYFYKNNDLYVNLFIASTLTWKAKNVTIQQATNFPYSNTSTFTIHTASSVNYNLNIRYPYWCSDNATVLVNGKKVNTNAVKGGYISLNRKWNDGDIVSVTFPMTLSLEPTNDNQQVAAITYGPIVLAGAMGKENFVGSQPFSDPTKYNDYYTYNYNVPKDLVSQLAIPQNKLNDAIELVDNRQLIFKVKNQNIMLKPLFDIHQERYVAYWNIKP